MERGEWGEAIEVWIDGWIQVATHFRIFPHLTLLHSKNSKNRVCNYNICREQRPGLIYENTPSRECSQIYLHFKICRDATFTVVEKSSKLVGIITEFSGNNNRDIHYYEKQCREINVYSFQNTTLYKTIVRIVWTVYPFTKKLSRPRFKIWKFYETLYPFFLLISIYI